MAEHRAVLAEVRYQRGGVGEVWQYIGPRDAPLTPERRAALEAKFREHLDDDKARVADGVLYEVEDALDFAERYPTRWKRRRNRWRLPWWERVWETRHG